MDEMNELKNKVIQKLEKNGILSQLKAQMRSKVFEIIDNEEKVNDNKSPFFTNNPNAEKLYQNDLGKMSLELFQNFLDNYNLDCTKKIFKSESNYQESNKENENLIKNKLNVRNKIFMKDIVSKVANIKLKNEKYNEVKNTKKMNEEWKFENEGIMKKIEENKIINKENENIGIEGDEVDEDDDSSLNTEKIIKGESIGVDETFDSKDLKNYFWVENIK